MKTKLISILGKLSIFVGFFAISSAFAADEQALARQKNCMTCHAMNSNLMGPSYKSISLKYKGKDAAQDQLVKVILEGGTGVWGGTMPANKQIKPEEAARLAQWILGL